MEVTIISVIWLKESDAPDKRFAVKYVTNNIHPKSAPTAMENDLRKAAVAEIQANKIIP